MSRLPDERIYYAQNREDLILESFFPDRERGFYVDVGACHPDVASVTKRFYLKGWRGINVEPQKNLYGLFVDRRKNDINLNIGISDRGTKLVLRNFVNNQGMSTMTPQLKAKYKNKSGNNTEDFEDITIDVITLKDLFDKYKVKSIQFLKVDVEGHEYEVLKGNNWNKYRPEVVCIEADHVIKDWRPLFKQNGYTKVFSDGLNEYYVDDNTDRAQKFDFIGHVLMELKGGISAPDFDAIQESKKYQNRSLLSKLTRLD
jgi:FkbM family methyltransferase